MVDGLELLSSDSNKFTKTIKNELIDNLLEYYANKYCFKINFNSKIFLKIIA